MVSIPWLISWLTNNYWSHKCSKSSLISIARTGLTNYEYCGVSASSISIKLIFQIKLIMNLEKYTSKCKQTSKKFAKRVIYSFLPTLTHLLGHSFQHFLSRQTTLEYSSKAMRWLNSFSLSYEQSPNCSHKVRVMNYIQSFKWLSLTCRSSHPNG